MLNGSDIRVAIGSGDYAHNNPHWLHTREDELNLLRRDDWLRRFGVGSLSAILAEHVWEHLTQDEGLTAARICHEFLKPGGYVRCAVPDGYFPNTAYQHMAQVGGPPGIPNHPAASHKVVYNYRTLSNVFARAGFRVLLLEYSDESGAFHSTDWDPAQGLIYRTLRYDHRNQNGQLGFASLLLDAVKPD
ncbi:MAG: class I SAM-dependent methyltransferase [Sulfobacillus sp.]